MAAGGVEVTVTPTQSDSGQGSSTARWWPEARGGTRLVNWTGDGIIVEVGKVEVAWGMSSQPVDSAGGRCEIFSLWVKGKHWSPSDALKLERSALASINRVLGDVPPSGKLIFMLREHGALGALAPADAVPAEKSKMCSPSR